MGEEGILSQERAMSPKYMREGGDLHLGGKTVKLGIEADSKKRKEYVSLQGGLREAKKGHLKRRIKFPNAAWTETQKTRGKIYSSHHLGGVPTFSVRGDPGAT